MKWLPLLLCVFSPHLQAEEVTVTGYGKTVDEALQNAKTAAVEQVAGTFITGRATLEGNHYRSRIDQYNGGLIKRHHIVSTTEQDGLFAVRIEADVDTDKTNSVIESNGAEITAAAAERIEKSRDDYAKTQRIVEALDDPAQAFAVQIKKVDYRNRGELTDVTVQAEVVYSPKWYDDVRVMAKTIGRKIDIGSPWADALWGLAALMAIVNPTLPGTMFSLAHHAEAKPRPSSEYMVCFGKDNGWDVDECYEIRHPLTNTTGTSLLRLAGRLTQGDEQVRFNEITVDTGRQLFMGVTAGQNAYFVKSGKGRKFINPGIVLFCKGAMPFNWQITVPTRELAQGGRIEFVEVGGMYVAGGGVKSGPSRP